MQGVINANFTRVIKLAGNFYLRYTESLDNFITGRDVK